MWMYGLDANGNRICTLEKSDRFDCWRGQVQGLTVEAVDQAGAENCLRHHGAKRVVRTTEPVHLMGIIIAM